MRFSKRDDDIFAVQIVSAGSTVDDEAGDGKRYAIDTWTILLNGKSMNDYLGSDWHALWFNTKSGTGDREWRKVVREATFLRRLWRDGILLALELPPDSDATIAPVTDNVFAVCYIHEIDSGAPLQAPLKSYL